ncbi:unnamed protein product [Oikopleura dioica]|uniref:Uncharacterized protein n=1 Tax=Oikopleura dioica TaxID=34765 RepID=E4YDC3_OIKDI|nr:unnamed protein product [Oikopleura dioica]
MSGFGRNRDGPGRDHRLDRDRSRSASRDSRGPGRGGRGGFRGRGRGGGPRVSEKEMERKQVKDDIAKMNYEGEAELLDYRAHIAKAYDTLNINAGIERLDSQKRGKRRAR